MAHLNHDQPLNIIGRAESVRFVDFSDAMVPAKVDTGADISSVWASHIKEEDGHLSFRLFGPKSDYFTGETITLPKGQYKLTRIANSFGAKEMRYVVKLRVNVNGRVIKSSFTLANRSLKIYPVLLGRRLLKNKFLVDVSKGSPLIEQERKKLEKMHVELSQHED